MADIPSNVSYGTVIGRFLLAYADTDDSGLAPDAEPAQGTIFFTPSAPILKNINASPAPVTILPATVQAALNDNGYIKSFGGTSGIGIRLIATDDEDNNPYGWTWRADFRLTDQSGAPVSIPSFNFELPADSTVDLTIASPVTLSDGITYATGPKGDSGEGLRVDGSVADASLLPEGSEEDQSYITEDTGHLWVWDTENWIDVGPFVGPAGQGVPTGGEAGNFLVKINEADNNTTWSSVIDGGAAPLPLNTTIQVRRDTLDDWISEDPILEAGEIGFEVDTNRIKIGNGFDSWSDLEYTSGASSIKVSETEPSEVTEGSVWFNSTEARTYIYYDNVWVDLNPGLQGPKGEDSTVAGPEGMPGIDGINGIDGVGVPAGGDESDILVKVDSDDYNTTWAKQNFRIFTDTETRDTALVEPSDGMLTYLEDVNRYETYNGTSFEPLVKQGLTLIKTQTIGSALTALVVENAFSAEYDNYKIMISGGVGSANSTFQITLGNWTGTTFTATATNYFSSLLYANYTANTPVASVQNAATFWNHTGSSTTTSQYMDANIYSPFLSTRTFISAASLRAFTWSGFLNGYQNSATSFNSFRINTSSGTMTGGTIRVYGYRKDV
jgi:hypothetical protein